MQFACAFPCLSCLPVFGLQVQLHPPPAQENKEPEEAVGTVVACDRVNHALACHSTSDSLIPAANTCLQHRGRLLSASRNSDGPRFYTKYGDSDDFLFRASGRLPNVRVPRSRLCF